MGTEWFSTKAVVLTSGVGHGSSEIVAFDAALRAAKIADFNLIRVTSIVPPRIPVYAMNEAVQPISGDGCMLPAVYARATASALGEVATAAVGVGVPSASERSGVIFTNDGLALDEPTCLDELEGMISEGMSKLRRTDAYTVRKASASITAGGDGAYSVALAALCFADRHLWPYFRDATLPLAAGDRGPARGRLPGRRR